MKMPIILLNCFVFFENFVIENDIALEPHDKLALKQRILYRSWMCMRQVCSSFFHSGRNQQLISICQSFGSFGYDTKVMLLIRWMIQHCLMRNNVIIYTRLKQGEKERERGRGRERAKKSRREQWATQIIWIAQFLHMALFIWYVWNVFTRIYKLLRAELYATQRDKISVILTM